MKYSLFNHVKSKIPLTVKVNNWYHLISDLTEFSYEHYDNKEDAMLLSPAHYYDDALRINDNVLGWDFMCLDIDSGETVREVSNLLNGLEFFMYSTASCTIEHPKFRVMIPFESTIQKEFIPMCWYSFINITKLNVDQQCKDASRIYYLPGQYKNADNFLYYKEGEFLNGGKLLDNIDIDDFKRKMERPKIDISKLKILGLTKINKCLFVKPSWMNEYIDLPSGQDLHYRAMYNFMLKVAGNAKHHGYSLTKEQLGSISCELDLLKDGRWNNQDRDWLAEAQNAIDYIYGG